MKEFENPFDKYPLRNKPWYRLQKEETSYIIYNLYRTHFITSEDVKSFIDKHRRQMWSFYAFPLIGFPIARSIVNANRHRFRVYNVGVKNSYAAVGTLLMWYVFSYVNPFRLSYEKEKDNLLNYLDANMGMAILNFNNMLPRYWTENWVNQKLVSLYRQKNSWFTGILYPPEGFSQVIHSEDSMPEQPGYGY